MKRNLLAPGIKSFQSYLQSNQDILKQTPILLICSEAGASSSKVLKPVGDSCQWIKFTLGQRFGMRTVPTTISSAFPTNESLEQTLELMQRTGASSVVSVGSGAAIDLGKAVRAHLGEDDSKAATPLIMVPSTYSGLIAAGASHSLFFDGIEETLVPLPRKNPRACDDDSTSSSTTVATLDQNKYMEHLSEEKVDVMLYALSSILFDAGSRMSTDPSLPILLQETIDLVSSRNDPNWNPAQQLPAVTLSLRNLLCRSAGLLSYGLSDGFDEEDNRSIPIALGSSLIPTLFPETHPIAFMASLAPGLAQYYAQEIGTTTTSNSDADDIQGKFQSLILQLDREKSGGMRPPPSLETKDDSLEGFSIPDMAVSHIQTNQEVWKPLDVPDDVLMKVLQHSLKQS